MPLPSDRYLRKCAFDRAVNIIHKHMISKHLADMMNLNPTSLILRILLFKAKSSTSLSLIPGVITFCREDLRNHVDLVTDVMKLAIEKNDICILKHCCQTQMCGWMTTATFCQARPEKGERRFFVFSWLTGGCRWRGASQMRSETRPRMGKQGWLARFSITLAGNQ